MLHLVGFPQTTISRLLTSNVDQRTEGQTLMLDPQSCPYTSNQYLCEADALVYAGIQAYTIRPIFFTHL